MFACSFATYLSKYLFFNFWMFLGLCSSFKVTASLFEASLSSLWFENAFSQLYEWIFSIYSSLAENGMKTSQCLSILLNLLYILKLIAYLLVSFKVANQIISIMKICCSFTYLQHLIWLGNRSLIQKMWYTLNDLQIICVFLG